VFSTLIGATARFQPRLYAFGVSAFLVSIPVFVQAPLVRSAPLLSLAMTALWLALGFQLRQRANTRLLGSLLFGFTLSWWCGALYWGWLREFPIWHLPVEALGLPIAFLARKHFRVGSAFYIGSLLGTTLTDVYLWGMGLIPWWGRMMRTEGTDQIGTVLTPALQQMYTLEGIGWMVGVSGLLLGLGLWALKARELHRAALAGAVLSTLLVGGLFWSSAMVVASLG